MQALAARLLWRRDVIDRAGPSDERPLFLLASSMSCKAEWPERVEPRPSSLQRLGTAISRTAREASAARLSLRAWIPARALVPFEQCRRYLTGQPLDTDQASARRTRARGDGELRLL
jgi:hypothetical protein